MPGKPPNNAFQKENPTIQVQKVLMTGDSRPQFLKTLMAAGNLPDVMLDPAELAKIKDVLAPLPDDLLAQFEEGSVPVFKGHDEYKKLAAANTDK